jgi:hypothetical protein
MEKRVFTIRGQSKPQGLFYSSDFKRIFVANGEDGTCKTFIHDSFRQTSQPLMSAVYQLLFARI